jgi:hypothetical protein
MDQFFLAYFPYFEKIKVGLWDHHAVFVSLYPTFEIGLYIMAPEPIFINLSHQSPCLFPPVVARLRLGKNVIAATNTHATAEGLLDTSFTMLSMSYRRKIGD